MKVMICIGSSCHVHGSRPVVEQIVNLVNEHNLQDKVELGSTFCMGKCRQGVCVTVDDVFYSVSPDKAEEFFNEHILGALK